MYEAFIAKFFFITLFIGRGLLASVVDIPDREYYGTESVKPRIIRDVVAATWPHLDEMELDQLEDVPRSSRNSELEEQEATILIKDFWKNYGKSADELQGMSESEQNVVERTKNKEEAQEEEASSEDASFRFSTKEDIDAGRGKEESQQPQVPSQQPQYPSISTLYPVDHRNTVNYQYPNYLPLYPQLPYSGPIPLQQGLSIGNPYAAGNVYSAPSVQVQNPYKPLGYNPPTQSYPSSTPYQNNYGSSYNGQLPLTSIPPYILQKLLMDANLQGGSSYHPNTHYFNPPSKPSSIPQPAYSFAPNTPETPLTYPNSNIIVKNGQQTVPSYPYSSSSS